MTDTSLNSADESAVSCRENPIRCNLSLHPSDAAECLVMQQLQALPKHFRADSVRRLLHAGLFLPRAPTDWYAVGQAGPAAPYRVDFQLFPSVQEHSEILELLMGIPKPNRVGWLRERILAGAHPWDKPTSNDIVIEAVEQIRNQPAQPIFPATQKPLPTSTTSASSTNFQPHLAAPTKTISRAKVVSLPIAPAIIQTVPEPEIVTSTLHPAPAMDVPSPTLDALPVPTPSPCSAEALMVTLVDIDLTLPHQTLTEAQPVDIELPLSIGMSDGNQELSPDERVDSSISLAERAPTDSPPELGDVSSSSHFEDVDLDDVPY